MPNEYWSVATELPKELCLAVSDVARELAVTEQSIVAAALTRFIVRLDEQKRDYACDPDKVSTYKRLIETRKGRLGKRADEGSPWILERGLQKRPLVVCSI